MNSEDYERYFGKDYYEILGRYSIDGHFSTAMSMNGNYRWEKEVIQKGIKHRYNYIRERSPENCTYCKGIWRKILFVGCGKGFEVLYFRNKGYDAWGIDISKYAIDNCHPDVKKYVFHEDICDMDRFKENEFNVVASWDVLGFIDHTKQEKAIRKISQLAKNYIQLKFIVEGALIARKTEPDGYDGGPIYLKPLYYWVQLVEKFNKFRLREVKCTCPSLTRAWATFWRVETKQSDLNKNIYIQ